MYWNVIIKFLLCIPSAKKLLCTRDTTIRNTYHFAILPRPKCTSSHVCMQDYCSFVTRYAIVHQSVYHHCCCSAAVCLCCAACAAAIVCSPRPPFLTRHAHKHTYSPLIHPPKPQHPQGVGGCPRPLSRHACVSNTAAMPYMYCILKIVEERTVVFVISSMIT